MSSVMFIGHGSPLNAIEKNEYSRVWKEISNSIPKPDAILCISAHWVTNKTKEHFAPLLYILGAVNENDNLKVYNNSCMAGSLSMTSFCFYRII